MDSLPPAQSPLLRFDCGRYRFLFRARNKIHLRHFSGSAWRGLFGKAMKQAVCLTGQEECKACLLQDLCSYPYIFETPAPRQSDRMRRYSTVPHPYVFKLARRDLTVSQGELFSVDLLLFGRARRYLPFVIHTFQRAGSMGITSSRAHFDCVEVRQPGIDGQDTLLWEAGGLLRDQDHDEQLNSIPQTPSSLCRVELLSPLRLMEQNKPLQPGQFRFHHLFRAVMRRIPMLMYFHQGIDVSLPFRSLVESARQVTLHEPDLTWQDWERYSTRQNQKMKLGGLVGHFDIDLRGHEELWPLLWLGQFSHAGKATVMGNGEYRLGRMASLPDAPK